MTTTAKTSTKPEPKEDLEEANASVPAQKNRSEAIEGVVLDEKAESFKDRLKRVAVSKKTIGSAVGVVLLGAVVAVIRQRNTAQDEQTDENIES